MIAATVKLDPAMESMLKNINDLKTNMAVVGVISGTGTYKNGAEVVEIAQIHEFGVPVKNIPPRSFLRVPFSQDSKHIQDIMIKSFISVSENNLPVKKAYDVIGAEARNVSINAFGTSAKGQWEPLKESTIKAKGSSKPLIDTGRLRQSIQWEVRDAK